MDPAVIHHDDVVASERRNQAVLTGIRRHVLRRLMPQFYEFTWTMQAYKSIIAENTTLSPFHG